MLIWSYPHRQPQYCISCKLHNACWHPWCDFACQRMMPCGLEKDWPRGSSCVYVLFCCLGQHETWCLVVSRKFGHGDLHVFLFAWANMMPLGLDLHVFFFFAEASMMPCGLEKDWPRGSLCVYVFFVAWASMKPGALWSRESLATGISMCFFACLGQHDAVRSGS